MNMPAIAKVQQCAEDLLQACSDASVAVTGFIYAAEPSPLFLHFGNLREKGLDLFQVHQYLGLMMLEREDADMVKEYIVQPKPKGE